MVCHQFNCQMQEKPVFNVDSGKVENLRFLRMNTIYDYNNTIDHVDISDKLKKTYIFDHWLCNCKWWWLLLFWVLAVMLVNT